jgi:hypothetical protein
MAMMSLLRLESKEIEQQDIIYNKIEHPVAKSLYLYLIKANPRRINISTLQNQIIKSKNAAFRILMIISTLELQEIGFLKDSVHSHDSIEFIYA